MDLSNITDRDLLPINRIEATFWRDRYHHAMLELIKANRGLARLARARECHIREIERLNHVACSLSGQLLEATKPKPTNHGPEQHNP